MMKAFDGFDLFFRCVFLGVVIVQVKLGFGLEIDTSHKFEEVEWIGVGESKVSVGTIPVGKTTTVEVRIKNRSHQELSVSSVKSSCGCISARLVSRKASPGNFVSLELSMNPRSGEKIEQSIEIRSEEEKPIGLLRISGRALEQITISEIDRSECAAAKGGFRTSVRSNFGLALGDAKVIETDESLFRLSMEKSVDGGYFLAGVCKEDPSRWPPAGFVHQVTFLLPNNEKVAAFFRIKRLVEDMVIPSRVQLSGSEFSLVLVSSRASSKDFGNAMRIETEKGVVLCSGHCSKRTSNTVSFRVRGCEVKSVPSGVEIIVE